MPLLRSGLGLATRGARSARLSQLAQRSGQVRRFSAEAPIVTVLKSKIKACADERMPLLTKLKKEKKDAPLHSVTVAQAIGGMRGIQAMVTETSDLDAHEGIRYRGRSLFECNEVLPKAKGGEFGLPEAAWWLLLTNQVPSDDEIAQLNQELRKRAAIPDDVKATLAAVPSTVHPMTQLGIGLLSLQAHSKFADAYRNGKMTKQTYWEYTLEDSLSMIAQIPILAAMIYRKSFKDGVLPAADPNLDWAGNYAHMLGCNNDEPFKEITRLYLMLHADHEGGNVSAHATHLVGSALSDPYYAWAAGVCGLAGPLHGLANQECLKWLEETMKTLGSTEPTVEVITDFAKKTLASGKVIPGFGHAVLRATDPRYTLQHTFAKKYLPNDATFKLADTCLQAIPPVLQATGKVANPWPNVDALSGTLMKYYGLKEADYYTVVFAVSRALGVTAQLVWSRVLGMPIERPKSVTLDFLAKK